MRTTLAFDLTAPAHMVALANGAFVGEKVSQDGTMKTTSWKLDSHVCPSYLICIAVGDFEQVGDPFDYFMSFHEQYLFYDLFIDFRLVIDGQIFYGVYIYFMTRHTLYGSFKGIFQSNITYIGICCMTRL
jgi:hypothetical protein